MKARDLLFSLGAVSLVIIAVLILSVVLRSPLPTPTPLPTITLFPTPTPEVGLSDFSGSFAASPGLAVQGVQLTNPDGSRFIAKGINLELYRDPGDQLVTVEQIKPDVRTRIIDKWVEVGINIARVNYSYSWLNQGSNLNQFLDWCAALAARGIYFMPSDHTFTGKPLTGLTNTLNFWAKIVQGVQARGISQWLVVNPYNEPYSSADWSAWIAAQKTILNHMRNNAGYSGVVILDSPSWAASFDVNSFKQVQTYDASLLGSANVAFSNHYYPNIAISNPTNALNNAGNVPLVIGEIGQINPGSSGVVPSYARDVFRLSIQAIPKGFNGVFAWIWVWSDENTMARYWDDQNERFDGITLTTFGQLVIDEYYSKIDAAPIPTLTPGVSPQVTSTSTRTATATRTATIVPTVAPTATKTASTVVPTPLCLYAIDGYIGDQPIWICVH